MFVDKWKWAPLYAPDAETGTGEAPGDGGAPPPAPAQERPDGPGSGRGSLRKELEKQFEAGRTPDPQDGRNAKGRFARGGKQGEEPEPAPAAEGEAPAPAEGEAPAAAAIAAPEAYPKEIRDLWATVPPAVQAAIVKREQDVVKGVEGIKAKYADLDRVLAPRLEMFRQHGRQPHEAVDQLLQWFEALGADSQRARQGQPLIAFPALLQSFGLDPRGFVIPQEAKPAAQPEPAPNGKEPAIAPEVQQYIGQLQSQIQQLNEAVTQRFGTLENTFQQQSQAKTNDMVGQWAKDKPHYEAVRQDMAQLLAGGFGRNQDGSVDLDMIYDRAVYGNPSTRALEAQAQQAKAEEERKAKAAAERKAQQEQADKARRAAVGVAPGAPGAPAVKGKEVKRGKTVAESLREAIAEANERQQGTRV